jgi:hypothetical protein
VWCGQPAISVQTHVLSPKGVEGNQYQVHHASPGSFISAIAADLAGG